MSIWEKLRNWVMDLYYWRTERNLVKDENCELWKMVQRGENMREALNADHAEKCKEYEERIDALAAENARLAKTVEAMEEALREQYDLNACLLEDWGKKHTEWAVATKEQQDKDDADYKLWAEHKLLLATVIMTEEEEAKRYHV
ncbi:MAG: hypothetical protein J6K73_06775 [Clostridia bacterium]|nr:hypothetical protein [Clostridia bacterium]